MQDLKSCGCITLVGASPTLGTMTNKTTANNKEVLIVKASGETEPFSEEKLRRSLERVSASPIVIEKVLKHINKELKDGMRTSDIYRHAFSLLRKANRPAAARYSLKEAVRQLGPSGYPFEKFIGELFKAEGFSVQVGKVVQGLCVAHEIDVIAEKNGQRIMAECKFHNQPGIKSDVKVALYIQARFQDVEKNFNQAWLVTNTKLTSEALTYSKCVGMKAIGWSYPPGNGLEVRIDKSGIQPLTCLTTISGSQKRQLLDKGVVLCKDVLSEQKILKSLGLREEKISLLINEINQLCGL